MKGLHINLWVDDTLACVIILALGVTIYKSCKVTRKYLNLVAVLSAILILSALCVITYISILYTDYLSPNMDRAKPRNFALETAIVCYDLVLLVIAVKYLTIGIKMKLNVEGVDPTTHDSKINLFYLVLTILNIIFPLLGSLLFVLQDKTSGWRVTCVWITFIFQLTSCAILIYALY